MVEMSFLLTKFLDTNVAVTVINVTVGITVGLFLINQQMIMLVVEEQIKVHLKASVIF